MRFVAEALYSQVMNVSGARTPSSDSDWYTNDADGRYIIDDPRTYNYSVFSSWYISSTTL